LLPFDGENKDVYINRYISIFLICHLKQFSYICCKITLSFFIDSAGRYLFLRAVSIPDILCIIRSFQSKTAMM